VGKIVSVDNNNKEYVQNNSRKKLGLSHRIKGEGSLFGSGRCSLSKQFIFPDGSGNYSQRTA
jgi:hypothetical protein